jgi:alkylation response protein AidB-like acyl-CoA dehydrogenase
VPSLLLGTQAILRLDGASVQHEDIVGEIDRGATLLQAVFDRAAAGLSAQTLAAKEAIQMHGGIGVTDEHDIGFYMKRAQATHMTSGQPSQHRQRWAELHGY